MPHARSRDGARIYYEVAGRGTPLILCTASFSTHRHWRDVRDRLARRLLVVTWDYRGHGLSEAPEADERYSLERVVEDLAAVHEAAAGDAPAVVGGLSVGGIVGLSYALARPDRVRALVLVNTGPGFKRPEALRAWNDSLERAAAKMERVGLEAYLEGKAARAQLMGQDPDSEGSREAVAGILTSSVAGLARFARCVAGPVPNLVDELGRVKPPALILIGAEDPAFQRASEVMKARLPDAERVVLPGAGHVANLDQPEAFVREIERFLEARGCL